MSLLAGPSRHGARYFLDALRGKHKCARLVLNLSTDTAPTAHSEPYYKTDEQTVKKHTLDHEGKLFTIEDKILDTFLLDKIVASANGFGFGPYEWMSRSKVFGETCVMVRKPALEIINYINASDLSQPALRYVLYGKDGCGKSVTLTHLICYGYQENFIVMPFSWMKLWLNRHLEVAPSTYTPGHFDHIVNANNFLKAFKHVNADRLAGCVTHREYVWSARDKTEVGSPLLDVVDLGCERLVFAADAFNVLIRELKLNCNEDNCKLMVLVDGVNCLFSEHTFVHRERRIFEKPKYKYYEDWKSLNATVDECTTLVSIKKLLKNDYKNAVVITTADKTAKLKLKDPPNRWWISRERDMKPDTESHLPFALLGEGGWSHLEPFIPVEVNNYSEHELNSMIDYNIERRWLRKEAGNDVHRREIDFLTGRNPFDFFQFSAFF